MDKSHKPDKSVSIGKVAMRELSFSVYSWWKKAFTTEKALYEIGPQNNRAATMIDFKHTLILFRPL
jgi:hypothetical protein